MELVMIELELGSTGAVEMSVFQRLFDEKGTNPPRLAFCPSTICWHDVVEPPVPPEPPDPPEPPEPPEPPALPLPPLLEEDMPPLQPNRKIIVSRRTAREI
jgi:hypothetical protein